MTIDVFSIHRALNVHLLYIFALSILTPGLSVQPDFHHTFPLCIITLYSRVLRVLDRVPVV